jgi:hypothetical protein
MFPAILFPSPTEGGFAIRSGFSSLKLVLEKQDPPLGPLHMQVLEHFHFYSEQERAAKCGFSSTPSKLACRRPRFLRKSRVGCGSSVSTRSENAVSRLEKQFQRKLQEPRRVASRCNGGKSTWVQIIKISGLSKLHIVEGVECLCPELNAGAIRQSHVLEKGRIKVVPTGSARLLSAPAKDGIIRLPNLRCGSGLAERSRI